MLNWGACDLHVRAESSTVQGVAIGLWRDPDGCVSQLSKKAWRMTCGYGTNFIDNWSKPKREDKAEFGGYLVPVKDKVSLCRWERFKIFVITPPHSEYYPVLGNPIVMRTRQGCIQVTIRINTPKEAMKIREQFQTKEHFSKCSHNHENFPKATSVSLLSIRGKKKREKR